MQIEFSLLNFNDDRLFEFEARFKLLTKKIFFVQLWVLERRNFSQIEIDRSHNFFFKF